MFLRIGPILEKGQDRQREGDDAEAEGKGEAQSRDAIE